MTTQNPNTDIAPKFLLSAGIVTAVILIHIYATPIAFPYILPTCLFSILAVLVSYNIFTQAMLLPDFIIFPGTFVGLICNAFLGTPQLQQSFYAIIIAFTIASLTAYFTNKKGGIGYGHVKSLTMLAAFFDIRLSLLLIILSTFFSIFVFSIEHLINKRRYIRTGPSLAIATVVTYFWGEAMYKYLLKL